MNRHLSLMKPKHLVVCLTLGYETMIGYCRGIFTDQLMYLVTEQVTFQSLQLMQWRLALWRFPSSLLIVVQPKNGKSNVNLILPANFHRIVP